MPAANLDFSLSKPQIPSLSLLPWSGLKTLTPFNQHPFKQTPFHQNPKLLSIHQDPKILLFTIRASFQNPGSNPHFFPTGPFSPRPNPTVSAGRSKKKPGGPSPGRIEGNAEIRRQAKRNARIKSRRLAENLFYRLKNPSRNHANKFTEEELQMIGLGYDRMVRFMDKDDPNLRHPYDWYKYGEFGPYSWRGIVLGDPIRGRLTDECVTLIGEVKDHEEWEEIERHDMAIDFNRRLKSMDKSIGFKYYWVFVRHPKWRISELPWQQWTLVCEVVLESGEQRLDKWNLMGRLGNKTRELITQCAAWMRPDIIYVKRPIFQCRFEPQADFFKVLGPLLDPSTENQYQFELELEDGRIEMCTYFGGLCKIVRVNPKAFVDDVVKAYEKLSDERKSQCLEFLLSNHPVELLHPYTNEWKVKLEEMELGCDAPDETFSDDERVSNQNGTQITDWIEEEDDDGDNVEEDDAVMDVEEGGDEALGIKEEATSADENEIYWEEEFKRALGSNEKMEKLVTKSIKTSNEHYKKQLTTMNGEQKNKNIGEDDNMEKDDSIKKQKSNTKHNKEDLVFVGYGPRRRAIRSKVPPELFLRAAVRPFTYRNLVKEIVLLRHAIIDGEVSGKQ